MIRRLATLVLWGAAIGPGSRPTSAQEPPPSGPLVVLVAGSLAAPMRDLLGEFRTRAPGVNGRYEASGSVEAARKITDLGKRADVLATADAAVLDQIVLPRHASWYVDFASNAMVLAYGPRSRGAADLQTAGWYRVLTRPGVQIGRSDPAQDPAGYRALMLFQLAERHYAVPGLERMLLANSERRFVRAKSVELVPLLETGHVDYLVIYRSVALGARLPYLELPREIDLSDPAFAGRYAAARVDIPRSRTTQDQLLRFTGEPIAYAVTIPANAPNPGAARAFVRFLLGPDGRGILARHGFVLPDTLRVSGDRSAAASVLPRG